MLLLFIPGYLCYKIFFLDTKEQKDDVEVVQNEGKEVSEEENAGEDNNSNEITETYYELFPILEDQQAYVVVPSRIDEDNPPTLIIYSHGSNTAVTQNMEDQFMLDLQNYGRYFTQYNYAFAASNQHGINWGNEASLRDTMNLLEWVKTNYIVAPKINMIGFSMGGLASLNFASQNPDIVEKVALLAPSTRISEWNKQRVEQISNIDIKIWHGNADQNVSYSSVLDFVTKIGAWGKDIELVTLEGKKHYDVDTEYMGDILQFFNQ